MSCLLVAFCFSVSVMSPCFVQAKITRQQSDQASDDDYNFFSVAIIWGEFEIKEYPIPFIGLEVRNPYPYNNTMYVIGWVSYEHKFIYRNASYVYCPWWIGFVGRNKLFVVGWGYTGVVVD